MFVSERKDQVKALLEEGFCRSEVARRLGIDRSTVSRIAAQVGFPSEPRKPSGPRGETRRKVAELLGKGLRPAQIADQLRISKPTVAYHARKLGIPPHEPSKRRFDWEAIRVAYEAG